MSLSNLSKSDQEFALSLMEQAKTRKLSDKQLYWLGVLSEKAAALDVKEEVTTPISVTGIIELLRRNNNAKRPKIRFLTGDVEFTLSVAGSKSRFPGTVNVVTGNQWYGRIHPDGRYELSSRIDKQAHTAVIEALQAIAADPAKAAAEYGKKTGRCCFCALHLTDARSLMVGYGAICAKNYRLPWNVSELEKELLVKDLTNIQAFG